MESKDLVSIRHLTAQSDSRVLLKRLNVDIREGEFIGVAGESGSGKTMLIRAILNVLPEGVKITSDRFTIFGQDMSNISSAEWHKAVGKHIGFVPQNTSSTLHPMLKIKDQITDSYLKHQKTSKKAAVERAADMLNILGFDDPSRVLNSYEWELSGGMRQRVNIAAALMNRPRLIIADEPTTALDAAIQRQILEIFKKINEEHGTTIMMVSHDLGMLREYTDKNMIMYAGRMVEFASSDIIFDHPAHPYTEALIGVIPTLNRNAGEKLVEIPGYVPDSGRETQSCIFADRCRYTEDICRQPIHTTKIDEHHYCLCAKPLYGGGGEIDE